MKIKVKILALFLCALMLTGCASSLEQAAQALDDMAGNVQALQEADNTATPDSTTTTEPAADTKPAEVLSNTEEPEEEQALPSNDIWILYTSDVHCGVDQNFGYVSVKQIRDALEAKGYETILVDDGDAVQGEPIGTVSKGEAIIPIMNALKYDIAIPGNHEFDYGIDEFFKYTELADFPYISCNFNKNGKLVFEPYIIKEAGGKKIAFVGVTTPDSLTSVSPKTFMDDKGNYIYGFMQGSGRELYKAVQDAVDDARAEGADYVYVMGHMGNDPVSVPYTYKDVIENTSGIDVFLDGHSHDTEQDVAINKNGEEVDRSACGTKLNAIGYSHIKAEDGSIETGIWTWQNDIPVPELLAIDNEVGDLIAKENEEIAEELQKVVAKTGVDLTINDPYNMTEEGMPIRRVRLGETNMGDLCADAVRVRTGSDIGVVNGGGVRDDIKKGDITYEDIISVHPFGNADVVIEVTGQQMIDALEWSCHALPNEDGGFLQVSGISFEVDENIPSPCKADENGLMSAIEGDRRVSNVKVGGKDIDPDAKYSLSGNAFILTKQGNGFTSFDGAKVLVENAGLDNQLLIDYIIDDLDGTVGDDYSDPQGQERIVIHE